MPKHSTSPLSIFSDMAEGSPAPHETNEPVNPLKTTTTPVVNNSTGTIAPPAETGLLSRVEVKAEGKDDDETQDASRTSDETQASMIDGNTVQHTPTVLIVEDTMELAEVIQATLEGRNMVTVHETHGAKALNRFHEMDPDVVLLDISLPDMTGWKILDSIRERHEEDHTAKMPKIIIITAYGDPANRLVGKLQGVHNYLIKPFTTDEIENIVVGALGSVSP